MTKEKFLQGLPFTGKEEVLLKPENKYVAARVIELSCLIDFLLENGWIKPDNLKGPIIDLGTGNGVGLLALRQFTHGYLVGVDTQTHARFQGCYHDNISTPDVVKAAYAEFRHKDNYQFLHMYPFESASLITSFYSSPRDWNARGISYQYGSKEMLEEVGKVLDPGGQLLFTSDQWDITRPSWAVKSVRLVGEGSETENVLVLPVPNWVRSAFGDIMPELQYKYLEPEIYETNGEKIALLRDGMVQIYTKHNPQRKKNPHLIDLRDMRQ